MPLFRRPKAALTTPRKGGALGRWSYPLTVAAAMLAVALVGLARVPLLPDLSNLVFDWYQRLDPRAWDPASPVRVVAVDDESLARIGQWPWPRTTIATLTTRLGQMGAAVVAFDVVFAEPDGASPENVVKLLPGTPGRAQLEEEIRQRPSNDAVLAQALAQTPSVLGTILTQGDRRVDFPTKHGVATAGDDPRPFLPRFTSAVVPLPALSAAATGLGALNWLPDRDQIVRRVPIVLVLGDRIVPSLAVEALRVAQGASTIVVRSSNASGQTAFGARTGVNSVKVGDLEIPTDARGELRVRYARSDARRFIPAWKVLDGSVDRSEVDGRVMVLGVSAVGLRDQRSTPVDASVAGSEIHGQIIEQVLAGVWLLRPDWLPGAELALAALLALAFGLLLRSITALPGALLAAVALGILAWWSWHSFTVHGVLLDPILPGLSVAITYVACMIWLYRDEQHQRRFVREAFGRYVAPEVVSRLAADPTKLNLGGEQRTLTIMFCDIRGFTSMAESLDAQQLTQFMNEYLTAMTDVVLAHNGTIDKFIGDAVMAFWNAPLDDPDHAVHAASAALAMARELEVLNDRWQRRAQTRGEESREVRFGIGLATGDCSVGNFGSSQRFSYSALGDHVNLASRLEGATKFYCTDILVAEATRDLSRKLAWLEADQVRVKGRADVTRVFILAGDAAAERTEAFVELADIHRRLLNAYRAGKFDAAAALAKEAGAAAPLRLRDFYGFYESRCAALAQSRPDGWTPVTVLEEK
jgi:adenylate cyclase